MRRELLMVMVMAMLVFFILPAQANDLSGQLGIGVNFPGVSVKYGLNPNLSLEGKCQFASGIVVGGPRVYYNFNPESKLVLFVGGELDYVSFDTDNTSGNGFAGEVFGGGEYFLTDKLAFLMDLGPAYTKVAGSDEEKDGWDIVLNLGFNYYFSVGKK